jgi:inner membrane protein
MLGRTHLAFGVLLGLLYYLTGVPIWVVLFVPLASLLMDVDEKHSYVGRKVKFIAWAFAHRGFFHSIWFVLLSWLVAREFSQVLATSILLAYVGHLLLDAMSKAGIRIFWPLKWHIKGPVRVGKWEEHLVLACVLAVIVIITI